jgi:arylformamidase
MIIDISQPISPAIKAFPQDTSYEESFVARIGPGCPVNVGRITMSTHCGTHADAPYHYDETGQKMGEIDLNLFMGPCRVIDARSALEASALAHAPPRILLRLNDRPDPHIWNPDFRTPTPVMIELLAAHGVKLVGVDGASIDPPTSKDLPTHMAANQAGMLILENLVLAHVAPGDYELIALPLRLEHLDASPVRAVLRPLG